MIKKINLQIILLFSFLILPQFYVIAGNNSLSSLEITNKTREISTKHSMPCMPKSKYR